MIKKSEFPYCVDLLIADFCLFQSEFCYKKTKKRGEYADFHHLKDLINRLYAGNVFEINFGGGEPTLYESRREHEGFFEILKEAKAKYFRTGFVTKNYGFQDHKDYFKILKHTDDISIVCDIEEMKDAEFLQTSILRDASFFDSHEIFLSFQTSLELSDFEKTKAWIREFERRAVPATGLALTGKISNTKKNKEWIKYIKDFSEANKVKIAFDGFILHKWEKEIKKAGLTNFHLIGSEGNQTCVVDAINNTVKPYTFSKAEFQFDTRTFDIKKEFEKF